jgi:hypothetical protein
MERSPHHPTDPAKNETGDFGRFKDFVRRIVAVPHSEVKAAMEADKQKRSSSASRAPAASSKRD